MNHLKPFDGLFEGKDNNSEEYTPEQSLIQKTIRGISKNYTLGTDRLGNDEVFILSHRGISFEIFDMPKNDKDQIEYSISYKKGDDEWEELITTQLQQSIWSVIEGRPVEFDGFEENRDEEGWECEECGGEGWDANGDECYECGGEGWIYDEDRDW